MRITQAVIQFRDKLCTLDTVLDEVGDGEGLNVIESTITCTSVSKYRSGIVTVMI